MNYVPATCLILGAVCWAIGEMNYKALAITLIILEFIRLPFVVSPQKAKENLKGWITILFPRPR